MGKISNKNIIRLSSSNENFNSNLSSIAVEGVFEPIKQNGQDIFYISQDNYYMADILNLNQTKFYCDSATSCIVMVIVGYSAKEQKTLAVISHLSRPGRFDNFFRIIYEKFSGEIDVYASGANPPYPCNKSDNTFDHTALNNVTQVIKWISSGANIIKSASLNFGQDNPSIYSKNLDCFSIGYSVQNGIEVNNDRIYLTGVQRDPNLGVQTLFCIYGDSNKIRLQSDPFSEVEIKELVDKALEEKFEQAAGMTDIEILSTYSSTPDYEVPWFCSTIREAGKYVKDYY